MRARVQPRFRSTALRVLLLCGGASHIVGCTCSDDHPYTPFEVATTLESGGSLSSSPPPTPSSAPPSNVVVAVAARGQTEWKVFDRTVKAPPGLSFERGFQFGADGEPFFWLTPTEAPTQPGHAGLYQWSSDGTLHSRFPLPDFLPEGPDCVAAVETNPSGQKTLLVQVQTTCQTKRLVGTPMSALAFVDADSKLPPFGVRLLDSAPGEQVRVSGQAEDQDGDGLDDREIILQLESPKHVAVSASFRWLSRPAGPSRRTETPPRDVQERADRLAIAAIRKKERAEVPAEVDAWRRLYGTACAESTTGRIALLDGEPLRCGPMDRALASLTHSSITARLGQGDSVSALGELQRADWFGSGPDERQLTALRKLFAEKFPEEPAELKASLDLQKETDGWLGWDRAGRLWLRSAELESPIWPKDPIAPEPETTDPTSAPRTKSPDPRVGPGGRRLIRVLPSCDRSEVQVLIQAPGETTPPKPLPLLAPRPAACDQFGRAPLRGQVIQFRGSEADLLIEGEPISESGGPVSPRAPLAWHTKLGLAVLGQKGLRLRTTGRTFLEHNCAISDQEELVACLHERTVTIYSLSHQAGDPRSKADSETSSGHR